MSPAKGFLVVMGLAAWAASAQAQNARLTEWVPLNPTLDPAKIALGYPVPVPVDTPLPFDGFRSYAGLHARHQDLAMTTPWVHAEPVGTTRQGRTIWAYRLGDDDKETRFGLPEPAMLTNGGIHAREWQTPEAVTGIMELIAAGQDDAYFYDYLRDNVNMIVVPALNIDGFLQTQRTPALNYLGVDPEFPDTSPRDGRMRRKNMLGVDEILATQGDMLGGVDLNRNNAPYWNTNPSRSSGNPDSLVYHGASPASEPETRAINTAARLGPIAQLRLYTDMHSFSQVHFWGRNNNYRLATQTEKVLNLFSRHHASFPAGKWYAYSSISRTPISQGIGTTDEYFTQTFQVPSWTLEVEPTNGQAFHAPLPGCGADYGGEANNCHDGFILPESQIRRVREDLARSFAAVYYRQAGPPSVRAMRVVDADTGAVVQQAEWKTVDDFSRQLQQHTLQELRLGRTYVLWLGFDKPMRWREGGEVVAFPGQVSAWLNIDVGLFSGESELQVQTGTSGWGDTGWEAPGGYLNYGNDAWHMEFTLSDEPGNQSLIGEDSRINVRVRTYDMTGLQLDADPSTVARWWQGAWANYENSAGNSSDTGGEDSTLMLPATDQTLNPPFLVEAGMAGAWYDPARSGEGFMIEMLADGRVVMYWFTYGDDGGQDWYIAVGEARGNRILFPRVLRVSGGVFGDDFDPDLITETPIGSATFTWSGCSEATMNWHLGNRSGRQDLIRLTHVMGMDCGVPRMAPLLEAALFNGSWYDPSHAGEGYTLQILANGQALVFWFSFGPDGGRRWFFGVGELIDGKLVFEDMLTTVGGAFGDAFDPDQVEEVAWGRLELDLACEGGTAMFSSTEQGFASGQLDLIQLTRFDGLECADE